MLALMDKPHDFARLHAGPGVCRGWLKVERRR